MFEQAEALRKRLAAAGKPEWVAGPQSEKAIVELERLVETRLPSSYRRFLQLYGAGFGVHGLSSNEAIRTSAGSLWGEVQRFREHCAAPKTLIPIYLVSHASSCCLDLSQLDAESECPVVEVAAKNGSAALDFNAHSLNFGEFFLWRLERLVASRLDAAN